MTSTASHARGPARAGRRFLVVLLLASLVPLAADPVRVEDAAGMTVALSAPAARIVSLAPHITELLYVAGAGARLVGAVEFSDFPDAASALPRVGSHARLNLEVILQLEPDLIVGWLSGNSDAELERVRRLSVPLYLSEPRNLESIATDIQKLGMLAGTRSTADAAAAAFRARLLALQDEYRGRAEVSVFYEVWNQPLITINGAHLISDLMTHCGGRNVFHELPLLAPTVSVEAVLARDPEVLIGGARERVRGQWLAEWQRWPEIRAVRNRRIYFIDPDLLHRHTPRILDGMAAMCDYLDTVRGASQ